MGDIDGPTQAQTVYQNTYIENPELWVATALFKAAAGPIKQLARGSADREIKISWETLHGLDPGQPSAFLAYRAKYKQQRLAELLQGAIERVKIAAPRGSKPYYTDKYQCPNCGPTAVNWVADSTLCMRCSSPTDG